MEGFVGIDERRTCSDELKLKETSWVSLYSHNLGFRVCAFSLKTPTVGRGYHFLCRFYPAWGED